MLDSIISCAIPHGLSRTELCFVFVFLAKLSEVHDEIKSPTAKLLSNYNKVYFDSK